MANLKDYKIGAETYQIITDEVVVGSNKSFWDIFMPGVLASVNSFTFHILFGIDNRVS